MSVATENSFISKMIYIEYVLIKRDVNRKLTNISQLFQVLVDNGAFGINLIATLTETTYVRLSDVYLRLSGTYPFKLGETRVRYLFVQFLCRRLFHQIGNEICQKNTIFELEKSSKVVVI